MSESRPDVLLNFVLCCIFVLYLKFCYFFSSLIIFVSIQLSIASSSANISCIYDLNYYDETGLVYKCTIDSNLIINSKDNATINAVSQNHHRRTDNADVTGLAVNNKNIKFFPIGLEKIFKNLKLIYAKNNFIQEIDQSDLKYFSDLMELNFHNNQIKILEAGLFEFNPKLVFISFTSNQIVFIQLEVFDGLSSLEYLYLNSNNCTDEGAYLSHSEVLNVIERVKNDCLGFKFKEFEKKLNKLESMQSKTLKVEIESFEAEFNQTLVRNFSSLIDRLNKIKVGASFETKFNPDKSSEMSHEIFLVIVIAGYFLIVGSILFFIIEWK